MAIREGEVAGIPARVCRVSFSGELAFEVNVDGRRGLELWEAIHGAGERDAVRHRGDARPPRREGLPDHRPGHRRHGDAARPRHGLDRLEDEARLHRQALVRARRHRARRPQAARRAAAARPERLLPEGAQLVADPAHAAVPMLGHVTSSYRSAALGRTFALALVASGRERIGETVLRADRRSPPRSSTPCSTTRRERAVMAVLRELELEAQVSVRGEPQPASRSSRTRPPRSTADVLWLGPDEWLVLGGRRGGLPGRPAAAVDVSANRVVLRARRRRTRRTCSRRAARSTCTRRSSRPAAARRRCSPARR